MQQRVIDRARRVLGIGVRLGVFGAAMAFVSGCKDLTSPDYSGTIIDQDATNDPSGANGIRIGALGALKMQTASGETLWHLGGLLTDEWKSAAATIATNDIDRRAVSGDNASLTNAYNSIQQTRGFFKDAIRAMTASKPDWRNQIGELYLGLGFLEMQMAENFCSGIPFGTFANGVVQYGAPNTNTAVLNMAVAHFDSALALFDAGSPRTTDTADVNTKDRVRPAVLIAKARALIGLGKFTEAAALVPASAVPTAFQYLLTFSTASGVNGMWNLNTSQGAYTLADSVDASGRIANAVPFASVNDPRVPRTVTTRRGTDGSTIVVTQGIWTANNSQVPLLSGLDARLIEAEAKLKGGDIAGMTTLLNGLRTDRPTIGTFRPAAMTALTAPAAAAAVTTFFREKSFWTFGRGQRLGDLRRMIRQYSSPAASVFPTGTFFKGGTYGSDINFPVPDAERVNPQFTGCIDREA